MTSTSTNYNLTLYDRTGDTSQTFVDYRDDMDGTGAGSNMNLIDAAMKAIQDQVDTLDTTSTSLQSQIDALDANARERLTSSRTYYVRTDGSNSNDGLTNTTGGAWLTMSYALSYVYSNLDCNGKSLVIQVGDGTYGENVYLPPMVGAANNGTCVLRGNTTTPSNCIINGTGSSATIRGLGYGNDWLVEGFKVTSASSYGILGHAGAWIRVGNMEFGACSIAHVSADQRGTVELQDDYTISAGSSWHSIASKNGYVLAIDGITVTISGTPAFSSQFVHSSGNSLQRWPTTTFSGSATGVRYQAITGGGIDTNGGGATYFPGDSSGISTSPGWYA